MTAIINSKNVLGGKPRISGTRISIDVIGSYLSHGYGIKEIKHDYPHLTDEQVGVALRYLEKRAAAERKALDSASS